ncbi:MAG: hypothetical protein LUF30_07225 [Lachnospiraceae bacterium]|nr:hypothetical protein [Lachnospiraceae bacterium]
MQGLGLANEVLDSWLYGGDPAANLSMAPVVEELNALVDTGWYFRNYSYEDRCALRKAVLDATTDNFAALAGELRKACEESAVCVVGPASLVEVCQPERMSYL